jgi:outer membrane protein OmpA-like peptidoglycan-associated protein
MIASMLTAIRSFVNDWVDKNEKYQEVNTIEYGGSKIVLESSGYSYLAVIVDGSVSQNIINDIHKVLSTLVSNYSKEIKDFNGDMKSVSSDEFYNIISKLINTKNEEMSKKIHPIIYIIPLILISYLTYNIYNNIVDNNLENKANEILYKTPTLTLYRLDASVNNKELTLNGVVPFESYKQLAYEKTKDIENIKNIKNSIQVIDTLDNPKEIKDKIKYLQMILNSKDGNKIDYIYEHPVLQINARVINTKEKALIQEQFKIIEGLNKIRFNIQVIPSEINEAIYFEENSFEILEDQEYKLINIINILKNLDEDLVLEIQGFRDSSGTIERNAFLVQKRAETIMKYLKLKGNVSQKLVDVGINDIPSNIDLENYPEQARRVIFTWKK